MSWLNLYSLTSPCKTCKSTGEYVHDNYGTVPCEDCRGTGLIPEPHFRAVLEFIRKWIK